MRPSTVERRLRHVGTRLRALRDELAVADEQLAHLDEEAEDARIRALVSETDLAQRDHQQADQHARAMARHRASVLAEIEQLERDQDDLLDRLGGG